MGRGVIREKIKVSKNMELSICFSMFFFFESFPKKNKHTKNKSTKNKPSKEQTYKNQAGNLT